MPHIGRCRPRGDPEEATAEPLFVAGALGAAWGIVQTVRLIVRDDYGPTPDPRPATRGPRRNSERWAVHLKEHRARRVPRQRKNPR